MLACSTIGLAAVALGAILVCVAIGIGLFLKWATDLFSHF